MSSLNLGGQRIVSSLFPFIPLSLTQRLSALGF